MRAAKQMLSLLLCLLASVAVVGDHAVASAETETAAETTAASPPPTVSFSDPGPLALDEAKLNELAAKGKGAVEVDVHNGLGRAQRVSLEVIGLDQAKDPALAKLFANDVDTHSVPAGETSSFRLTLTKPVPKAEEGTYSATLLAFGLSGGLARRELTVTYPPAPGKTEKPDENSLNPARPIDITMHAVNYLPSPLSSLLGLGLFIAVSLLLTAALFWQRLARKAPDLPIALLAAATLIGAVSLVGAVVDGPWDQPSLHLISSRPIDLAPQVPSGIRGTVSAEDGTIAQLTAAKRELRARHLGGANKYTGKYNLSGETGVAEAAATVNVRDYWIYAALTITLGLIIGFLLHRWFQETRPKNKIKARLQRVIEDYRAELAIQEEHDRGKPYEKVSITERVHARAAQIGRLLDSGETTPASEKVTALGVYVERFVGLRMAIQRLDKAIAELAAIPRLEELRFDLAEADGYQEAKRMLETTVDSAGLDADEEELKGRLKQVTAQVELIEKTTLQAKGAIRHLLASQALAPACRGDEEDKLKAISKALFDAAHEALQADSIEDLKAAEKADDKALRELEALSRPIRDQREDEVVQIRLESALMPSGGLALGESDDSLNRLAFIAPETVASTLAAEVSSSVPREGGSGDARIHVGDAVLFEIAFSGEAGPEVREIEIDFGDGTQGRFPLPPAGQPLRTRHRYSTNGSLGDDRAPSVTVYSLPDRARLGSLTLKEILPEPRQLPAEVELAATDKVVNRAAFVLAVASGMFALYFADPSWGQPMDYLGALVWGGATGEGVKFAAGIADRVWPAP
jgi:hypothetical protein